MSDIRLQKLAFSAPMMNKSSEFLFLLILLVFCSTLIKASEKFALSEEDDSKIVGLPGQPSDTPISQFSGYITVNQKNGRALFYWFFEALSEPSTKPLLLWLNGGPGCSSIGAGAVVELGPLLVDENGGGLHFNKHSWIKEANLLFVESPVGVGFSYTNTSSDFNKLDDEFVAEDAYSFMVNWLAKYPQFKNRDFYLSGESYAGHYVPQLAELIFDRNKDPTKFMKVNLKGFVVGNPATDNLYDSKGLIEYAWSHTVISDEQYNKTKEVCDFKTLILPHDCETAIDLVYAKYDDIDLYNIYAPICLSNNSSSSKAYHTNKVVNYGLKRPRIYLGGYDPCFSNHSEMYFNRADVQASLHANANRGNSDTTVKWKTCNDSIENVYNMSVASVLPVYKKLIQGGLKIWIYSGDVDGCIPVIGTRYWVEALGLPMKTPWRSWYHQHQVGGRLVEYEGLTLVTVRGAGHLVPNYQ